MITTGSKFFFGLSAAALVAALFYGLGSNGGEIGMDALELGRSNGRVIEVETLSSLDRDLLKDTLNVVKRFKAMLRQRYRLDML